MSKVYVLMVERWGGNSYYTEVEEVFKDEELAHRMALLNQGKIPTYDVRYFVEAVDYNDLEDEGD